MYKKVNINNILLTVLGLFTCGYNKEYYIREMQRKAGVSPRTSQLILEQLEKKSVLESKLRGKIKTYKIKKGYAAENYLVLAEQYKKIQLIERNGLLREVLQKVTEHIDGIGLIFGSYAKGTAKESSDLDLFVSGKCNVEAIEKIGKLYSIEINVNIYPPEVFNRGYSQDIFLKEIIENHIIFLNSERFVRTILQNG